MARIRTIKPDFWTDETITECSLSARLLFIGSWNFADDNGNLDRSYKQLKMKVFPGDDVKIVPLVHELIAHGLLIEYSLNGNKYLHIKGFEKHQIINRPSKTQIPIFDESLMTHEPLTEDSLTEGKGRELEGKGLIARRTRKTTLVFIPPTLQEVTDYCKDRDNRVDPVKWHAHYTSNGWKVGKNTMQDWKAAIVTWERNNA
jgi:hypothetical protein